MRIHAALGKQREERVIDADGRHPRQSVCCKIRRQAHDRSALGSCCLIPGACTRSTLKRLVQSAVGVMAQLYSTPPFWAVVSVDIAIALVAIANDGGSGGLSRDDGCNVRRSCGWR